MKNNQRCKAFAIGLFLLLTVFAVSGCTGMNRGSSASPSRTRVPVGVYYDFKDVLIPKELKIIDAATVVVSTPGYLSGVISLKGRVDARSLFSFFTNNMAKDNWNIITNFKSPVSTIMIFQKASRWSVITIRTKDFYTYVEVGVAPTIERATSSPSPSQSQETELFN